MHFDELEQKLKAYTMSTELQLHINLQIDQIWTSEYRPILVSDAVYFFFFLVGLQS